jgi:hypothetical protein
MTEEYRELSRLNRRIDERLDHYEERLDMACRKMSTRLERMGHRGGVGSVRQLMSPAIGQIAQAPYLSPPMDADLVCPNTPVYSTAHKGRPHAPRSVSLPYEAAPRDRSPANPSYRSYDSYLAAPDARDVAIPSQTLSPASYHTSPASTALDYFDVGYQSKLPPSPELPTNYPPEMSRRPMPSVSRSISYPIAAPPRSRSRPLSHYPSNASQMSSDYGTRSSSRKRESLLFAEAPSENA